MKEYLCSLCVVCMSKYAVCTVNVCGLFCLSYDVLVCVSTHLSHLCVFIYSTVVRMYFCTDMFINAYEEPTCEIQGVSANLPQVLVSRIPPVPINKHPK